MILCPVPVFLGALVSWWFTLFQIFKNSFLRYIQNSTSQ